MKIFSKKFVYIISIFLLFYGSEIITSLYYIFNCTSIQNVKDKEEYLNGSEYYLLAFSGLTFILSIYLLIISIRDQNRDIKIDRVLMYMAIHISLLLSNLNNLTCLGGFGSKTLLPNTIDFYVNIILYTVLIFLSLIIIVRKILILVKKRPTTPHT